MKRRVLEILTRIKAELDEAAREIELEDEIIDPDFPEIKARVESLEARVAAIELRGSDDS